MSDLEGFIATPDGVRLFYRTIGDGPRTLVVCNGVWLEPMLGPLAEHRRLVFFDQRSRGRSDAVEDPARMGVRWDIEDLEAVRRGLELSRLDLFGHSYLATVVALYAVEHPECVDDVIMVGPLAPRRVPYHEQPFPPADAFLAPPGVPSLDELRKAGIDRTDPAQYARAWYRDFMLPLQVADRASAEKIPLDATRWPNEWPSHSVRVFAEHIMPSLGDWDYRLHLAQARARFLIVQGAAEPGGIDGIREWAAHVKTGRMMLVPRSSHYPFVENPGFFFPAVARFLDGGWPAAAEGVIGD